MLLRAHTGRSSLRKSALAALVLGPGLALALSGAGCQPSDDHPERDLGGLLHSTEKKLPAPDAQAASRDLKALRAALASDYAYTVEGLGAHRVEDTATSAVARDDETVEHLTVTTRALVDAKGHYSVLAHNDQDYGRDVIYDGTNLYLRPRYGKYNRRPPETKREAGDLLTELLSTPSATLDLLAPGLAIERVEDKAVAGRAAVTIHLGPASSQTPVTETLTQRKWREKATIRDGHGVVALDKASGALLAIELHGRVDFEREGKRYQMTLDLERTVRDIGTKDAVIVPPEDQQVTPPHVLGELDEREQLLHGIAAPARRGKTPDNPRGLADPTQAAGQ